jgi:ribosomal-protein-alanine N-acetyltransferase
MLRNAPASLKTPRLNLRCFQNEDVRTLYDLLSDPQVRSGTTHWPEDFQVSQVREWLRKIATQKQTGTAWVYGIFDHRFRLMGEVSLVEIYENKANLTYWLGRPYWGQGYATEAGEALAAVAHSLGIHGLMALHLEVNPASGRVLEKLGFDFVELQERSHRGRMKTFKFYEMDLKTPTQDTDYLLA